MFELHLYDLSGIKLTGDGWGDDVFDGAKINSSGEVSIEITATGLNIYEGHLSAEEVATATPIQVLNYDIPGLAGFRITSGVFGGDEDFRGKYTVGDLVYCSATRCFYAFPEEKPNSITDLTNTTWYFKDSLEHCWLVWYTDLQCVTAACYNADFAVNFVVNDNQYDNLYFDLKGEGDPMADDTVYYTNLDSGDYIEAYYYGWEDESYRTITITGGEDVTNPDLITWITTNAVQTDISKPDSPETDSTGHYLLFSSPEEFTLEAHVSIDSFDFGGGADGGPPPSFEECEISRGYWNGIIEYSTDANQWEVWDSTTILSSSNGKLYLRGTNNTRVTGFESGGQGGDTYFWRLTGSEVSCTGNIETLLDYKTVANGQHPPMDEGAFESWLWQNSALVTAPALGATTLTPACYFYMFWQCENLRTLPELPATMLPASCYTCMFEGCSSIKLSTEKTDEYKYEYRIPVSGDGAFVEEYPNSEVLDMFNSTGGTFTGTPELNTVYYTSNEIVRAVQPEENKPTCIFDLTTLGLPSGSYTIYVKLSAEGYQDSEPSNEVVWEKVGRVVPDGWSLEWWHDEGTTYLGPGELWPEPTPDDAQALGSPDEYFNDYYLGQVAYRYSAQTNTWTVSWFEDMGATGVIIVDEIAGIPVTSIEYEAFYTQHVPTLAFVKIPKSITYIGSRIFAADFGGRGGVQPIEEIIYEGTKSEWNNIEFADDWNAECPELTITCTDGTITVPAYNS